jgi:hypothetical protein
VKVLATGAPGFAGRRRAAAGHHVVAMTRYPPGHTRARRRSMNSGGTINDTVGGDSTRPAARDLSRPGADSRATSELPRAINLRVISAPGHHDRPLAIPDADQASLASTRKMAGNLAGSPAARPVRLCCRHPTAVDVPNRSAPHTERIFARTGWHIPITSVGIPNRQSPEPVLAAPPGSSLCVADRSSLGRPPPADPGGP